jgi:hypothetical protein
MPFASAAQQRLMFSKGSPIGAEAAEEWADQTDMKRLAGRVSDRRTKDGKKNALEAARKALLGKKMKKECR